MCEFRNSKSAKEGWQSRILFKKRMFRETDETISEPQFINLSYVQVGAFCGSACMCASSSMSLTSSSTCQRAGARSTPLWGAACLGLEFNINLGPG